MTTKKKLPKDHPQKRQAKRKPRAPKIVTTPDQIVTTPDFRAVCVDFYGDTWATTERPANWMPTTPDAPKLPWADRIARWLNAIDAAVTFLRILLADRIHALARWVHPSTF
jgi:hypothetical protein